MRSSNRLRLIGKGQLIKLISETVRGTLLVVVPRVNLVRDLSQRTGGSIYCASLGEKTFSKITIATKQSLKEIKADLIVLDECFDDKTEILTENGFLLFSDLKDEKVAQVNSDKHELTFISPIRKIIKRIDGKILKIKSEKTGSIAVTENHDILTTNTAGKWIKIKAKDMCFNYNRKILLAGKSKLRGGKLSPLQKLLIAYQADGSEHYVSVKGNVSMSFSFSKERKIEDFLLLMKEGDFVFSETKSRKAHGKVKKRRRWIVKMNDYYSKDVSRYFKLKDITIDIASEIVEYMVRWDGHINSFGGYYFSSTSEKAVDFYQAICSMAGYKSKKVVVADNRSDTFSDVYRLFITKKIEASFQNFKKESVKYKGNVYCVTVPEGNIVTRRDGMVSVMGNCHNYTEKFLDELECKYIIGMTATPYTDTGYIYGKDRFWNDPCYEFSCADAINAGYLCDYKIFGMDTSFDLKAAKKAKRDFTEKEVSAIVRDTKLENQIEELLLVANKYKRKKIAILASNIEHAENIQYALTQRGEASSLIHSKVPKANTLVEEWKTNSVRFCCSVLMLSEGLDCPSIDCVVFLRPTRSARLMAQAAGRGLRLFEGKDYCLMLDFGYVFDTCGLPKNPKIPDRSKNKDEQLEMVIRQCSACNFIYQNSTRICPECNHEEEISKADYEENLKRTLEEEVHQLLLTRGNIHRRGKTKYGQDYLSLAVGSEYFSLFAFQTKQFLGLLSKTGFVQINYLKKGKAKFKVLSMNSF